MACERCGSLGTPAALYVLEKGGGKMRREFCDKCAAQTAAVYPLREIRRLREAIEPEPAGPEPDSEPEATEAEEAAEAEESEGQAPEPESEGEAEPSPEERQPRRGRPRRE